MSATTIVNATPVTPGSTTMWWVTQAIFTPDSVRARLVQSDGSYLIGNAKMAKRVIEADDAAQTIAARILAAAPAMTGKMGTCVQLIVNSPDPAGKTTAIALFDDKQVGRVADLFAVLGANSGAASLYADVMAYLGANMQ